MTKIDEAELLPCPFCGGEAICVGRGPYRIACRQCTCALEHLYVVTREEAIAAWNRRARDAKAAGLAEALQKVAEEAYWLLAWTWQAHIFSAGPVLDMDAFAPEARNMMNKAEQDLFDALQALAAWRQEQ